MLVNLNIRVLVVTLLNFNFKCIDPTANVHSIQNNLFAMKQHIFFIFLEYSQLNKNYLLNFKKYIIIIRASKVNFKNYQKERGKTESI